MLCVTMLIVVCGACLIKAMTVYIVLPVSAKAKERYYHIGGIDNKEKKLIPVMYGYPTATVGESNTSVKSVLGYKLLGEEHVFFKCCVIDG